jgi:hypothetical protein
MQTWNPISKWLGVVVALTVLGIAGARSEPASAQPSILSGWLHVIWADPVTGSIAESGPRYVLIDDQGQWTEITLDETRLRSLGGPLSFNRKRVTITGVWEEALRESWKGAGSRRSRLRVDEIQVESSLGLSPEEAPPATAEATPQALSGPQPWVTILCRFADTPTVTPRPKSYFDSLLSGVYPGLDHYWREVSYDNINITGSVVVGWYNLPQPRSYYVYDQNGDGQADLDFSRARNDCTAVADADVFFPGFVGINLMFNQNLDCCAWGGSTTLTRDGQTKVYRITWIPPGGYANQFIVGHEMGHGFGLPHSSGPYTATYDSDWDVMSGGGICTPADATYGCLGVHTISYHKNLLGVVPAARKYVATPGSSQTIVLERLGQPLFSGNYLMAQIPIGGSTTQFYTVEARRFAGYDNQIPNEAVVIHKVDTTRSDRVARVVDSDSDGDPNDAGAMWTPGETFTDSANGITVTVNAVSTAGFEVTIWYNAVDTANLVSSVLPGSRSVAVGGTATAFASIINAGSTPARDCYIAAVTPLSASFAFQTTHCATNQLVGSLNTPVEIPAGGVGCFLFALTPSSAIAPTEVVLRFACSNSIPAPVFPGINTFLFSASSTPPPDIIASGLPCKSGDGIVAVNLPGPSGANAVGFATTNVGTGGALTVEATTGDAPLPVTLTLCQTNPQTGACITPPTPAPNVTLTIAAGGQPTFSVFAKGNGTIAQDLVTNRIFLTFHEGTALTGPVRGRTSVALRTHSPACVP